MGHASTTGSPGDRARRRSCSSRASAPTSTAGTSNGWRPRRGTRRSRSTTAARGAATSRTGRTRLEQMADDAIAVLDHAGVDTAHVVGASMGGAISQIVAVKYPERTRSLTLACTAGRNHPWREELLDQLARRGARTRHQLDGPGSRPLGDRPAVVPPVACRRSGWLGPLALGRPAHAFAAQCDAFLNATEQHEELIERLPEIDVPTLVARRQPGHPHAARRQRGPRRSDPDRRTRRDQRGRARLHGRARHDVQPGAARVPRASGEGVPGDGSCAEPKPSHLSVVAAAGG